MSFFSIQRSQVGLGAHISAVYGRGSGDVRNDSSCRVGLWYCVETFVKIYMHVLGHYVYRLLEPILEIVKIMTSSNSFTIWNKSIKAPLIVFITARRYASAVYMLSSCVCPSVCLFVASRSSTNTAKPRITRTTPYDIPGTLVFWGQKSRRNSNGITPNVGSKQVG